MLYFLFKKTTTTKVMVFFNEYNLKDTHDYNENKLSCAFVFF